jgi:hypothetical protein
MQEIMGGTPNLDGSGIAAQQSSALGSMMDY